MGASNKMMAKKLLNELLTIQRAQAKDHYETANILLTLREGNMHTLFERDSWREFLHKDVKLPRTTGERYVSLARALRRLRYNKTEAISQIEAVGWAGLTVVLQRSDKKLSNRVAMKQYRSFHDETETMVMTLTPDDALRAERVLEELGLEKSKNGRRQNLSEVFMSIVEQYEADYELPTKKRA